MPTKTIKLPITVGLADEILSKPEIRNDLGLVVQAAETVIKHVAPGTPVTLDAGEADALLARFGGEIVPAKALAK
ncbi:UNVERIFIED_CONTAM: hypothetical protein Q9R58_28035 [Methylobacteriaceae bacterium AG10]|nr:hypothetical protein [Methylobacteriaceae bacterium AG10]